MPRLTQRCAFLPGFLLAMFCVTATMTIRLQRDPRALAPPQPDGIRPLMFAEARRALEGVEQVGYVHLHDQTNPDFPADGYLYLTQYALAPVLVEDSISHDRVLGLVFSPHKLNEFLARTGMIVREDFGNGLVLLENEGRK